MVDIPPHVSMTLAERSEKLHSDLFPQPYGQKLADAIDQLMAPGKVDDRMFLDVAIVTTQVAHAFDSDENNHYCFQEEFRSKRFLTTTIVERTMILTDLHCLLKSCKRSRSLSCTERELFLDMHSNCRAVKHQPPLLQDESMKRFLDSQVVRELDMNVRQVGFHGLSSFDGTVVYAVTGGADLVTVPHELEHNIRRFVLSHNPLEQARLVSPQKDLTLEINGVQCESGFVSEHRYHKSKPNKLPQTVPHELISPFSARWNRRAFR